MGLANNSARYGTIAMSLHWLIAGAVIANICLGLYMSEILADRDPSRIEILQLHKSVGLTVLTLSLTRLGWRLINPAPPLPNSISPWLRILARGMHYLLYFLIIAIPLSGWALVSLSRANVSTFYFGLFHWPNLPFPANIPTGQKHTLHHGFNVAHVYLAFSAIALVPIHVAAALYHQYRGDEILGRMLPSTTIAQAN